MNDTVLVERQCLMLDKTTSDGVFLHVHMAQFLLRDNLNNTLWH